MHVTHTHTHTHTQCPPRTIKRLIDNNLAFHKAIAWMIIVSSSIHVIAHLYNYERLVATPDLTSFLQRFPWEQRRIPNLAQPSLPAVQAVSQQCDSPELIVVASQLAPALTEKESSLIPTLRSENFADVSTECFSLHQDILMKTNS